MLPLRSDYVLAAFLKATLGARVSFIAAIAQELVSTPS